MVLFTLLLGSAAQTAEPSDPLPHRDPASLGMKVSRLQRIDAVVAEGLRRGNMPGCVVLVAYRGNTVWLKAYGDREIQPDRVAMTTDTLFDLASLTKPIATAASIMMLSEQGMLSVTDPVSKYLPEFKGHGKEAITVAQLLTHQSGLLPDNALSDYSDGPREAFARINALDLRTPPGTQFAYSDVGFIVLGQLVQRLSGEDLHVFSRKNLFQPLGMTKTSFLPPNGLRQTAAPTQQREGRAMRGEVHDPRAYRLGGIAGHAGLFSTAEDLARYAQMLINGGTYGGRRIMQKQTVAQMTAAVEVSSGLRTLGWDCQSPYSSNRGDLLSDQAFGHGGFTGTALWVDPPEQLVVIFLSNRLHPDGKGSINALAGRIATLAAAATP